MNRPTLSLAASTTALLFTLFTTVTLHAHPGHGLAGRGVGHIVTSPYHLAILALLGGSLWLAGFFVQGRWPRSLLRCAGLIALISAVALWGLHA